MPISATLTEETLQPLPEPAQESTALPVTSIIMGAAPILFGTSARSDLRGGPLAGPDNVAAAY